MLYRTLRHFNTSSDEYSVLFVGSCTAALNLVADGFQFHQPLPQLHNNVTDNAHCVNHFAAAGDCFRERKAGGGFEEFPTKFQHGEVLCQKSVEDYQNRSDASKALSDAKFSTYTYINSDAADYTDDKNYEGCDILRRSELPVTSCEWNSEPLLKPTFLYLADNHTSVIGMRGVIARRGTEFRCMPADKMDAFLSSIQQSDTKSQERPRYIFNSLFAYPAQSNFSGYRYPLEWVDLVSECKPSIVPGTRPNLSLIHI